MRYSINIHNIKKICENYEESDFNAYKGAGGKEEADSPRIIKLKHPRTAQPAIFLFNKVLSSDRDILVRIRIRVSVPLTNGSGFDSGSW